MRPLGWHLVQRSCASVRLGQRSLSMEGFALGEPPSKRARTRPADALGDEMKQYEAASCDAVVDMSLPCVVRLDGHCFHTFTRGFRRPYDIRIHTAMVATATDLLERFQAVTAYTESDEISLLFPPSEAENASLPFNGRVQKIV